MRSRRAISIARERESSPILDEAASSADPITPTLIFVGKFSSALSRLPPSAFRQTTVVLLPNVQLNLDMLGVQTARQFLALNSRRDSFLLLPPFSSRKPNQTRHQKENANADCNDARRQSNSIHQLSDSVIRGGHCQCGQRCLSCKHPATESIFYVKLKQHS